MKKYKFKNPAQLVITILTMVIIILTIVGSITVVMNCVEAQSIENKIIGWKTIIISKGDTIWEIVSSEKYNGYDPRLISNIIEEKNNITGSISIGQELYIPVMK